MLRHPGMIHRLATHRARVLSKSEDGGAPIGRVRCANKGSLSAPRRGDILEPRTAAYHQWLKTRCLAERVLPGGHAHSIAGGRTGDPRGCSLRVARGQGLAFSFRKWAHPYRAASGAAPSPREADGLQLASSWTRDGRSLRQVLEAGIRWRSRAPIAFAHNVSGRA